MAKRKRWANTAITLSGLLLILAITLYPYDFCFKVENNSVAHDFLILGFGKTGILDVINNILLYIPLGFGLSGFLMQRVRLAWQVSLAAILLASFGLSYTIEVLQLFMPSRFPSLIDVFSNSVGGAFGFLCFCLWERKAKSFCFWLMGWMVNDASAFVKKNLLIHFLGYALFAFFISISFQQVTSLRNWDKTFHLLLGNERTGDRPWQGYISEVYITDRAISKEKIAQIFSEKNPIDSIGDSLLASYRLKGMGNYQDQMGHLSDLVWRGDPQNVQRAEGVFLGPRHWLETAAPAVSLTQRMIETSQFTLGLTVATNNTIQTGPARIISLSKDPTFRNFTLGQQGSDLVFRLRTPLTGENGVKPELVVPGVFSSTTQHNLVITYDGSVLRLYVDGMLNPHSLELAPGGISLSYLSHRNGFHLVLYKILYYAVIFIPFGILLLLTMMGRQFYIQIMGISGGILLPSFMLESILASVSGRDIRLDNMLISVMLTAVSMVLFKFLTIVNFKLLRYIHSALKRSV